MTPRFGLLDTTWSSRVREFAIEQVAAADEEPATDVAAALAADAALDLACVEYAAGADADVVRRWLRMSARFTRILFETVGTTVVMVTDEEGVTNEAVDWSLASVARAVAGIEALLAVDDREAADQLRQVVEPVIAAHPPDSAERELFAAVSTALTAASRHLPRPIRSDAPLDRLHSEIVTAAAVGDSDRVLSASAALVAVYRAVMATPEGSSDPRTYLCIPAVAWTVFCGPNVVRRIAPDPLWPVAFLAGSG